MTPRRDHAHRAPQAHLPVPDHRQPVDRWSRDVTLVLFTVAATWPQGPRP